MREWWLFLFLVSHTSSNLLPPALWVVRLRSFEEILGLISDISSSSLPLFTHTCMHTCTHSQWFVQQQHKGAKKSWFQEPQVTETNVRSSLFLPPSLSHHPLLCVYACVWMYHTISYKRPWVCVIHPWICSGGVFTQVVDAYDVIKSQWARLQNTYAWTFTPCNYMYCYNDIASRLTRMPIEMVSEVGSHKYMILQGRRSACRNGVVN